MKRWIAIAVLLTVALSSWAFGFQVRISAPSGGVLVFAPEEQVAAKSARGMLLETGISEQVFHFNEEYLVLLIQLSEPGRLIVEVVYLDENDQPLENRRPARFVAEGTFVGLRVRHPFWVDDGV